jgi:outer membrane receptor protein involved in Fe transport
VDVEFDWVIPELPAWSTHCALSAIQATDDQGDVLPWIPPNNARWELTRKGQALETLAMQSSVVVEASRDAVLVHAGVSWTSEGPSRRWVTNLQVMNLTNQTYIPTLSLLRNVGVPEPGRNVRLQLMFEW